MHTPTWLWFATATCSALGLALLCWAWWGDRARGRRRCPKCWYHMQGVPGTRCPECGHHVQREGDLLRPRRRWRWVLVSIVPVAAMPTVVITHQFRTHGWYWLLPTYKVASRTSIAGWNVAMLVPRNPEAMLGHRVRITRAGGNTFTLDGWRLSLGVDFEDHRIEPTVGLGEDLTGDGTPDLIITDYSGGAHCCTTYIILELGDRAVRTLQSINTMHSGARFTDLDGDGTREMITADNTFAYWNAPFVSSPMPEIVLRWNPNAGYQLAADLMRRAAPDDDELALLAQQMRESDRWPTDEPLPPIELWDHMLELIYTGHADRAWQLLRDAWPADRPGRDAFMVDFIAQLASSPHWERLREMNLPQPRAATEHQLASP